jgi:hypothetical protein
MTDVTRILSAIEQGDPPAAEQLLPLVATDGLGMCARFAYPETVGDAISVRAAVRVFPRANSSFSRQVAPRSGLLLIMAPISATQARPASEYGVRRCSP